MDIQKVDPEKSFLTSTINDIKQTIKKLEEKIEVNRMDVAKTHAIALEEQSKDLRIAITGYSSVK